LIRRLSRFLSRSQTLSPSSLSHLTRSVTVEGRNPRVLARNTVEGREGPRAKLPHEVCDHPNVDLSARLAHLWSHSMEVVSVVRFLFGARRRLILVCRWLLPLVVLLRRTLTGQLWVVILAHLSRFSRLLRSLGRTWIGTRTIPQVVSTLGMREASVTIGKGRVTGVGFLGVEGAVVSKVEAMVMGAEL
jgi:hypothetical protein